MTYAEKQVNWKITLGGLFYEKGGASKTENSR
jgi:hypothetical protein